MATGKLFIGLASSLLLIACGGGGSGGGGGESGDAPPTQNTTPQYTVSTSIEAGGSISPDSVTVTSGDTATFIITPDMGFEISAVSGCSGTLDGGEYTTGAITADCEVNVTFEPGMRAVPSAFTVDTNNRKLIGQISQFPWNDQWYNPFVIWGLDDDSYQMIPVGDDLEYYSQFQFDSSRNEIILPAALDGRLKLTAFVIDSGIQRDLLESNLNLDSAVWSGIQITDTRISPDNASLYLMVVYYSATGDWKDNKTVIFRYDMADGNLVTLVDGYTQSGQKIVAQSFALADSGILMIGADVVGGVEDDRLRLLDYEGQNLTIVSDPTNLRLGGIDIAEGSNIAYIAGYDGIAKANISDGTQQVLSLEKEALFFNVDQLDTIAVDIPANRILVGDSSYDYIFAVDTETGVRTEFAASGVGSGKHLLWPRAIEVDEDNQRAFVLDDGGNSGEILVEVDLETGDRTVLTRFNLFCNYLAQDLILDVAGGRVFAVFEDAVFEVSLNDGNSTRLTSSYSGGCGGDYLFGGGSLDKTANRLLLTDLQTDTVLALDLATKDIATVYSSSAMEDPADVELDTDTGLLYILSQANGEIQSYDPETGEATTVLDNCPEAEIGMSHGLALDPSNPWIWISGNGLMRFDLEANTCEAIPWKYYGYALDDTGSILDAEATSAGKLYGTTSNNVIQIDFATGELTAISR